MQCQEVLQCAAPSMYVARSLMILRIIINGIVFAIARVVPGGGGSLTLRGNSPDILTHIGQYTLLIRVTYLAITTHTFE